MDKRTCLKPSNNECFTWTQKNVCQVESSNFERTNKKNVSTEWRWALRCMCAWVTLTWCLARPNGAFNWSNTWQSDFSAAYQLCICILVWRLYAYIAMHWLINLILPLIYSICLFTCHRSMYLINIYPSIHLSIYLSVRPSVRLSVYHSISVYQSIMHVPTPICTYLLRWILYTFPFSSTSHFNHDIIPLCLHRDRTRKQRYQPWHQWQHWRHVRKR